MLLLFFRRHELDGILDGIVYAGMVGIGFAFTENILYLASAYVGDDGTGESHFSVEVVSPAFAGLSRVARQRLVNQALADLLRTRIHALAIRARAPGDS